MTKQKYCKMTQISLQVGRLKIETYPGAAQEQWSLAEELWAS